VKKAAWCHKTPLTTGNVSMHIFQVGLYDYYARNTKQWEIWKKMKRYRAALDREEQTFKQQECDF